MLHGASSSLFYVISDWYSRFHFSQWYFLWLQY